MVEALEIECQEVLVKILANLSAPDATNDTANDAIQMEQSLWNRIIKVYKENWNPLLVNYLVGFYLTLHEAIFFHGASNDKYLKFSRCGFNAGLTNRSLVYTVHIRLGDLYRYVDSRKNARYYYQKALQFDPRKGLAFNQLALCTPLTKPYQCLYFSIRAFYATVDPVKTAEANIKVALARLDCAAFERFRIAARVPLHENAIKVGYPETGPEWFHLAVISIHFNDMNVIIGPLLDQILQTIDCDLADLKLDFLFMSLDVVLDWILKDRTNVNNLASVANLKSFQMRLQEDSDKGQNAAVSQRINNIALAHNWMLKDFAPVKDIYEKMHYYYETERYQIDKHRRILVARLIDKLQQF